MNRFCQMAGLEQNLMEVWLKDNTSVEKYSAWRLRERWLVAALRDWRQSTDALFTALEKLQ